jgi:ADP-heptose:LPS heptosyltransferase
MALPGLGFGMPGSPEISSILVYSGLDLIGDGLMKLPFLRALRQAWPRAHITWLAGIGKTVYAGPLAELVAPYLDEVIEEAGIGREWGELWHRPLPGRRFDLIIDTQRRVKTTLIMRRIRHGLFISGAARFMLSTRQPCGPYKKERRMVDALLKLVELASGRKPEIDRRLVLPARYREAAAVALPAGPYLGLAPGAGGVHKRWPLNRFIAVAAAMADYRPVFLLGPDEAEWLAELRAARPTALLPLQDAAIDPDIRCSPLFTIACAQRLALAVANDSGTGHLLAAADIPLLSLFGPTDPAKFAPYISCGAVLRAQEFGGEEMEGIPVGAVIAGLKSLLNESLASS